MQRTTALIWIGIGLALCCPAQAVQLGNTAITSSKINNVWIKQQEFKLSWSRVTLRASGAALPYSELGSYGLYFSNSEQLDTRKRIIDKKLTALKLKQPLCTTYFYALTAIDTKANEGDLSKLVAVSTYCP